MVQLRAASVVLLAAAGLAAPVVPVGALVPGPGGAIAFMRQVGSNWDIYVLDRNGTESRLTTQPGADVLPSWSPDGTRIAFASSPVANKNAALDLWTMNADGSGLTRVTDGAGDDRRPVWSPDGSRLAFTTSRDGNEEIYVVDADGSDPVNITRHPGRDAQPAWSPDGTRIAFMSTRLGFGADIWVANADGSNPRLLTRLQGTQRHAAWSPDGTRIAFDGRQAGNFDVYVIDAEGQTPPVRLTSAPEDEDDPAWSPEGSHLLFTVLRDGQNDLFEMRSTGAEQHPIVATSAMEERADWSTAPELPVTVGDDGFSASVELTRQGTPVVFSFQEEHTATGSGGLLDSGLRSSGESYRYVVAGAGTYRYRCTLHSLERGKLLVPVLVVPQAGGDVPTLDVVWRTGPAEGLVSDIQIQRPGGSAFTIWRFGETESSALFVPDAGPGTYRFRARVRPAGSVTGSDYSPPTSVTFG